MNGNTLIRQIHRWLSILFTLIVAGIFAAQGMGKHPPQWVYFTPLAPLALMAVTGLYLFFLPYVQRRGGAKPG